ncbi:hypothetical protein [Acetobacter cibinongensis]|uniref:hypothetical protein n=1 Tax=Acetobacter cibinongensis TaxID=146475 RepID=UPI001F0A9A3C|nr:hypothetical protein [Acetobacter cibinongensis]
MPFTPGSPPEWVGEWLARRRPKAAGATTLRSAENTPDLEAARQPQPSAPDDDPKAEARRLASSIKRTEETTQAVRDALDTLEQWIGDQLRLGLSAFVDALPVRCRQIAARLVDGKASALASRVDEMPSRILALPPAERMQAVVVELSQLVQLACAFRSQPDQPAIRRQICTAEPRDSVLTHPETLFVDAAWEVVASNQRMQRDKLMMQTTWLLNLNKDGPRFAMLVDFSHGQGMQRGSLPLPGTCFRGKVAFYPAATPLRAILLEHDPLPPTGTLPDWPECPPVRTALNATLLTEPWQLDIPVMLPAGRIVRDESSKLWWHAAEGDAAFPLMENVETVWLGSDLPSSIALWANHRITMLAAQSVWGRLSHG